MKKMISLVLVVALVASSFCLEAFAKTRSSVVTYNGRKITIRLNVKEKSMITNMVISNAPIDGSILVRDEGYCRIKQGDKTIRRSFGTPKGLEAEQWVESYIELPSYQTMVETFAYYYANTTRLCWFEHVKP